MARKSRSSRRSRESPAVKADSPVRETVPAGSKARAAGSEAPEEPPNGKSRRATLSRELADFLVEFSIVLHKRSMYPADHPHLQDSADRFVRRMNLLLDAREAVTLGVARHRLVIENVTTDANNALLRDLAHRLHRHRIASVHLSRGATLGEIDSLLTVLSADPLRGGGPVGKRLDQVGPWEHVRLRPVGYDRFGLQQAEQAIGSPPDDTVVERDGWVELAQLALANESGSKRPSTDPLVVAEAIERKSGEVAYDRVVLGYLARLAEEMSGRRGPVEDQLLQRVSKLIEALDPEALRRLLEAGADHAERRKFVLNAAQVLAADAVLEVVEAAAQASHQTISHNLLRLLHKLAHHAEDGPGAIRVQAEGALRTNVAKLVGDWELEDPNPTAYNAILEGMIRRRSAQHSLVDVQVGCDADIILKMALELECVGPAVYTALEELLSRRELLRVAELLKSAPGTAAAEQLWAYVATPAHLQAELTATPLNPESVAILVERLGATAVDSILDRLASADDRSTRAALMKQLLGLGPGIGAAVVHRLPNAPWFLQRNILVLLGRLGRWPDGFSPATYATHADPRIRREAIKLLLESPEHQAEAVKMGLRDADDGIVALVLTAALESCPPDALPTIQAIATDLKRSSELRVLAARVLTRARTPDALRVLLQVIALRRRWFGIRMAPKSPELLAALAGLALYWRDDPTAAEVLNHAQQHSDSEIRAAARASA